MEEMEEETTEVHHTEEGLRHEAIIEETENSTDVQWTTSPSPVFEKPSESEEQIEFPHTEKSVVQEKVAEVDEEEEESEEEEEEEEMEITATETTEQPEQLEHLKERPEVSPDVTFQQSRVELPLPAPYSPTDTSKSSLRMPLSLPFSPMESSKSSTREPFSPRQRRFTDDQQAREMLRKYVIELKISESANRRQSGEILIKKEAKQKLRYIEALGNTIKKELHGNIDEMVFPTQTSPTTYSTAYKLSTKKQVRIVETPSDEIFSPLSPYGNSVKMTQLSVIETSLSGSQKRNKNSIGM